MASTASPDRVIEEVQYFFPWKYSKSESGIMKVRKKQLGKVGEGGGGHSYHPTKYTFMYIHISP